MHVKEHLNASLAFGRGKLQQPIEMESETKNRILQCAGSLFFKKGFSTGVDEIVSVAEVAKMSLYKHFSSKEGLICAVLEETQNALRQAFQVNLLRTNPTPREKLETACLSLCEAMHDQDMRGGLAVRALVDFSDPESAVHEKARQVDLFVLKRLERFSEDALLPNAHQAAREVLQIAKGYFLLAPTVGKEASLAVATRLMGRVCACAETLVSGTRAVRATQRQSR